MAWTTPSILDELAEIVRLQHVALAMELFGPDAVAEQDRAALAAAVEAGYVEAPEGMGELIGAWHFGSWLARSPVTASSAARLEGAPELSEWEQRMAAASRKHGAALVVGLGNRASQGLITETIAVDTAQALRHQRAIAEAVAVSIESGDTWKQAKGAIGEALGDDWARDLGRIAATETQRAVNEGYAAALEWEGGSDALVAVIPQPTACKRCLGFYLDSASGRPRIYKLADLPASSVNFKVKAADQVPCIPPAHPWCHCQLVHVEAGWGFDDGWNLVPPGVDLGEGRHEIAPAVELARDPEPEAQP